MSGSNERHVLVQLIRMKKQRAEQQLAEMQRTQKEVTLRIQVIQGSLRHHNIQTVDFTALSLAIRNEFTERIIRELEKLDRERSMLTDSIAIVEKELKIALHATRTLDDDAT